MGKNEKILFHSLRTHIFLILTSLPPEIRCCDGQIPPNTVTRPCFQAFDCVFLDHLHLVLIREVLLHHVYTIIAIASWEISNIWFFFPLSCFMVYFIYSALFLTQGKSELLSKCILVVLLLVKTVQTRAFFLFSWDTNTL